MHLLTTGTQKFEALVNSEIVRIRNEVNALTCLKLLKQK